MNYEEFLKETVKNCSSKADFCRALDKKPTGGNYATIDNIIKKYNLDISHFTNKPWNKGKKILQQQYILDEILVENSTYRNTYSLKRRLINNGILKPMCCKCGDTKRLELHHINGNSSDNRLENLQILCIKCHYDTENYRFKNGTGRIHLSPQDYILSDEEIRIREDARILAHRKKIPIKDAIELINNSPNKSISDFPKNKTSRKYLEDKVCPICGKKFHPKTKEQKYCSEQCVHISQSKGKPTKEELEEQLKLLKGNFTKLGKYFGVSDNAVRKWCKQYNLPYHSKEIKELYKI